MRTERVPDDQGVALTILFILGNASIFGVGRRAGHDIWLAFLLAIALSLPFVLLYARLRTLLAGATFLEGLEKLTGKWPARFLSLFYAFYAWRIACLVGQALTSFITAVALENTPKPVLVAMLAILGLWVVKEGVEVLARWSAIFLKIVLLVILLTFVLALSEVDIQNFLPFFAQGLSPIFLGALELVDFPFLETVLLLWALDSLEKQNSPFKILVPSFLFAAFVLMLITSSSLAVIGVDKFRASYFPGYVAVSRINIARFLSRLEITAGIYFVFGAFLKLSVCLLVASKGVARGLGFKDDRFLVTPLALALIPGSQWFTKSLVEIYAMGTKVWHPYDFIIQVAIPVVLWLMAEIKLAKS